MELGGAGGGGAEVYHLVVLLEVMEQQILEVEVEVEISQVLQLEVMEEVEL